MSRNEDMNLDDFLGEDNRQNKTDYGYPHYEKPKKKNTAVITLLCCILVVGVAVLMMQIFHPFNKDNPLANGGSDSQTEQPDSGNGLNGSNEGPQFYQGVPDGDGPQTYYFGSGDGGSGGEMSGELYINGQAVQFRSKDGKTEYSTDGGKTWSETPPEGMPPLP